MISRIGMRGDNMVKEVDGIEYHEEIGKRRKEGNPSIKKQDELKEAGVSSSMSLRYFQLHLRHHPHLPLPRHHHHHLLLLLLHHPPRHHYRHHHHLLLLLLHHPPRHHLRLQGFQPLLLILVLLLVLLLTQLYRTPALLLTEVVLSCQILLLFLPQKRNYLRKRWYTLLSSMAEGLLHLLQLK